MHSALLSIDLIKEICLSSIGGRGSHVEGCEKVVIYRIIEEIVK
jgi:hypothetical protein